jgi:hypothetical protein
VQFSTMTDGPWLDARLASRTCRMRATLAGQAQT